MNHPFDLTGFGDTLATAEALIGDVRDEVLMALSGPGSGEFRGEMYAGDACFPHNCPYSQALIVADGASKRLFVAWRIDGVETVVPSEELWLDAAHDALARWRLANPAAPPKG